jgi:hypothetical protein
MPWVEFEPTAPVFEREKTFRALDLAATVTGCWYSGNALYFWSGGTLFEPEPCFRLLSDSSVVLSVIKWILELIHTLRLFPSVNLLAIYGNLPNSFDAV